MSVMKDSSRVPQAPNALTIDRDSALPRCCRRCVRWRPAAAILSRSPNAAVMGGEAGGTSVSFARFPERPSTKRYVLMAQDTPPMEEILMSVR